MSFRRIDIDQYDEDAYTEDEILSEFESGLTPEQAAAASQTRSTDVRNLLTKCVNDRPHSGRMNTGLEAHIVV